MKRINIIINKRPSLFSLRYALSKLVAVIAICAITQMASCKKFIEIDAPTTSLNSSNVFTSDASAIAFVTGILSTMSTTLVNQKVESSPSISFFLGLSADELTLFEDVSNSAVVEFYRNDLRASSANSISFWNTLYPIVYQCNDAIAGVSNSTTLTPSIKNQLLGEALFCRAFCFYYLLNLYGEIPVPVTSDWRKNAQLLRSPKDDVWRQIIDDLKQSQSLLSSDYLDATLTKPTAERLRPSKWSAQALLSRAYLFTQDWDNATLIASSIISHSNLFKLEMLNNVFNVNSSEAIWQWPKGFLEGGPNTADAEVYILPSSGPSQTFPIFLNNSLVSAFEIDDLRKTVWIDSVKPINSSFVYYYPFKYKDNNPDQTAGPTEYTMVLRLGEQFLIRAEAEAHRNNINQAIQDLNAIRTRAGLSNYLGANDKNSIISAIHQERRVELFTEWGHRWLDLKRTSSINSVMSTVTPLKSNGATWKEYQQLYPIPTAELLKTPQITQNPGYLD